MRIQPKALTAIFTIISLAYTPCFAFPLPSNKAQSVSSHAINQEPENEKDIAGGIASTFNKVAEDTNFWPEFKINQRPMVLTACPKDDESGESCHLYAFNFTPQSTNWQPLSINNQVIYYSPTDPGKIARLPFSLTNPWVTIDNQQAIKYNIILNNGVQANAYFAVGFRLITYLLTDAVGAKQWYDNTMAIFKVPYTGFNQATNIAYLYMESQVLRDYLQSMNPTLLKDYAALEQVRKNSVSKETLAYEYGDIFNSLLTYSYMKVNGVSTQNFVKMLLEDELPRPKEVFYPDRLSPGYADYADDMRDFIENALLIVQVNKADQGWKATLNIQAISLEELLLRDYPMSESEVKQRVEAAKAHYNFDANFAVINTGLQPYLTKMHEQQERYSNMPGVTLRFANALRGTGTSLSWVDHYYIDNLNELWNGKPNSTATIYERRNRNTRVEFKGFSYIHTHKNGSNVTVFEAKISPNAVVTIDGQQTTVANLIATKQKKQFKRITINGQDPFNGPVVISLTPSVDGELDTTEGLFNISNV